MNNFSLKTTTYAIASRFVNKIGLHHFAHLRAVAEGIDPTESALRYLGVEHGNQARAASLQTIDAVRAIARRRGDRAWRLIGMTIKIKKTTSQPTLEDFIAERGLDDWTEEDVGQMYEEAFPSDPKATHRAALRVAVIKLLFEIADAAAEIPKETDMVSGWYDDVTANKLISAGILNLGQLQAKIALGGRWYSALPAIGKAKALRISQHLNQLLELAPAATVSVFTLDEFDMQLLKEARSKCKIRASHYAQAPESEFTDVTIKGENGSRTPTSVSPAQSPEVSTMQIVEATSEVVLMEPVDDYQISKYRVPLLAARSDTQAAISWVESCSGSGFTSIAYYRELTRILLWLRYERNNIRFREILVEDCLAYMNFLQHVPKNWMSRKFAPPFSSGWAPFRGQLNQDSFRQSIIIVTSMFNWFKDADWIHRNPWNLVNKKTGVRRQKNVLDTKAISGETMVAFIEYLNNSSPSPALERFKFILAFTSCVGLRSAELLSVKLKDFSLEEDGWMLNVMGKGEKERTVAVPDIAFKALEHYLSQRGNAGVEYASSELPLISDLEDSNKTIVYETLYKSVKLWLEKVVNNANIKPSEKTKLAGATTHWFRHTFGTTAVERGVPHDVIKDQMGHSSIEMVARLYGKAPKKRINSEMAKAFR